MKKGSKPEVVKKQGKAVIEALTQAIIFCSRDTVADPFKREGIPIPHRQSLLVQNLMSILVELVDIGPNQHTKITTFALKALKLSIRGKVITWAFVTWWYKDFFDRNLGNYKNSKRLHTLLRVPDFSGKTVSKDKAVKYYARIPVAPTFIEMYQYVPFFLFFYFFPEFFFFSTMDLMNS